MITKYSQSTNNCQQTVARNSYVICCLVFTATVPPVPTASSDLWYLIKHCVCQLITEIYITKQLDGTLHLARFNCSQCKRFSDTILHMIIRTATEFCNSPKLLCGKLLRSSKLITVISTLAGTLITFAAEKTRFC